MFSTHRRPSLATRIGRRQRPNRRFLALEGLEERVVLGVVYTVDVTTDNGPTSAGSGSGTRGDLRYVIDQADANPNLLGSTIEFATNIFAGAETITLSPSLGTLDLTETTGAEAIDGPTARLTISGGGSGGVFQVASGVTASLSGLTITGGSATDGAGLDNDGKVTLTACTVSGNSAHYGGGLDNDGKMTLTGCTVSGNSAGDIGGGIFNEGTVALTDCTVSGNSVGAAAGGIFNENEGVVTLNDCTISGNSAATQGGGLDNAGTATLAGCTISGNSASSGGGFDDDGTATLTGCTVSGNSASSGGGLYASGGSAALEDTIVAGNTVGTSASDITGNAATQVTGSFNLIGPGGSGGITGVTNIFLTDLSTLGLATLGDYGGPTLTMALLPGSAAIGQGTSTTIYDDQRGLPLHSPDPDIGAFQTNLLSVDTTIDGVGSPSGDLSLRQAVNLANALGGAETITFVPRVFFTPQTITLSKGLGTLDLTETSGPEAIDGPTVGVTVSGNGGVGVFQIASGVTASLSDLTITKGSAANGAGLLNDGTVTLTGCTVSDNSAVNAGGGLSNEGMMVLDGCMVPGNLAHYGGGLSNEGTVNLDACTVSGNTAAVDDTTGVGGGLFNEGIVALNDCTVSGNFSLGAAGGLFSTDKATLTGCTVYGNAGDGDGGGFDNDGTLTLTNCTVSGNNAGGDGGGFGDDGTLTLTGCTVARNVAGSGGGGLYTDKGSAALEDTIVASNAVGTSASDITGVAAMKVTGSYNLIGPGGSGGIAGATNNILTDLSTLGLAPIGDYGGPTRTMALMPGSAAIGKGTAVTGITTDQRGLPLHSPDPDIGAFQTNPLSVDTTIDGVGSPTGDLSLRQAVNLANALGGAETISFDPTAFAKAETITLTVSLGSLDLTETSGREAITGPGAGVTVVGADGVFQISAGVTASFSGMTISGENIILNTCGVLNSGSATFDDCTITGNNAALDGGGLYNDNDATVTLDDCTITGNDAQYGGGVDNLGTAILDDCTITGNGAFAGGGVDNFGTATLNDCTISGNDASYGGGVVNEGTATLDDCTISGNYASYAGGGVLNEGTATLDACTISGNSAIREGGGGLYDYQGHKYKGSVALEDTIVAGNTNGTSASDIAGNAAGKVKGSYNLVGTGGSGGLANGVNGNIVLTTLTGLGLAPLGDYGGPTQTIALLPGSPALDAGGGAATTATDQRGVPRGHVLDIGAYQATATQLVVAGFPSPTAPGVSHSFTVNAVDPFGQPSLDFNSLVTFSSSDPSAGLASGESLVAGQGTFSATLVTPGSQSITASADGLSGSQTGITVNGAPATVSFLQQDTTTQGSWMGTYGGQGYDIVSGPTSLPAGDTVTPKGQSTYTWTTTSTDPRALQVPGSINRVAAVWYSATSFTVDVNLADGQTHDLELYFLDWDSKGRGEQVQLSDAGTGKVLATETISSFTNGVYLDWKVSGNLLITITRQAGANAVLNGLFLDSTTTPTPTATASFLEQDTTTQGSWIGTYGAQGYDIVSGPTSLPANDTVTPEGQSTYTWTTTSNDPRALQVPGSTNRVAAVWYSATSFTVDVNLADGQTQDLELYFLDWDSKGRGEQVQLSDAGTGKVLATETISSFTNGVYLDWKVSGNLLITISRTAGANAVLNGLFVDSTTTPTPTATASFLEQDTTTQGSWMGVYGAQGYDIVSGPTRLPASDTVTPKGQSTYTWTTTSTDLRALQVPGSTNRVAAVWYSATSFTVDVNLADGQTHDLELYFLDWDSKGRSEQVQLSDAGTGKVLATETISSFTNGVYMDWKVSGNVLITITRQAGANAVLNGLFLDAAPAGGTAYWVGTASSVNTGSPPSPSIAGAPIARGSAGGFAISSAGGAVDAVLGALPDNGDAPAAGSSVNDLAMEQVSETRKGVIIRGTTRSRPDRPKVL